MMAALPASLWDRPVALPGNRVYPNETPASNTDWNIPGSEY
jgi:hypothetical protein